jgi:uncharacterized protein (TIGR03086 family)
METTDLLLLEKSFDLAEKRLAAAAGTPLTVPTPCTLWTLHQLANHLVALPTTLARAVDGEQLDPEEFSPEKMAADDYAAGSPHDADVASVFAAAAARALAACRMPGALTGSITMPLATVPLRSLVMATLSDIAVHAWDVARATEQDPALPDDLAENALTFMAAFITPPGRLGDRPNFAPVVAVPSHACATDRLVAFLGRTPR